MRVYKEHGVDSIDALILTHDHADAIGGLDELRSLQHFCPKTFEVTSSIDAPVPEGLGGSVSNLIVEPLGTHAVQALAVGCVCLILYSRWLSSPCIRAQCCCVDPDVESDQQTLASSIASDALKDTPGDTADAEAGAALDTKKLTESSRNQEFAL